MPKDCSDTNARKDLSARAGSFLALWGAPIAVAAVLSLPFVPAWVTAAAWTSAFVSMGVACLLNARRCGRLHCYFSGPILLLGAVSVATVAMIDAAAFGVSVVVAATLALFALTYMLELVWGRYRGPEQRGKAMDHG
jgi:hypothetical protein